MARHSRDLDACLEVSSLWKRLNPGDDVFIFIVGDTRYTIRAIENGQNKYIIDASSISENQEDDAKVRYILAEDLGCLEIYYILVTDRHKERCQYCNGVNIVYCRSQYSDVCNDCGYVKEQKDLRRRI